MLKKMIITVALLALSAGSYAQTIVALNSGTTLLRFSATAPAGIASNIPLVGLAGGDSLVGIDVRPANGQLYGIASSGRLYTIDPSTGTVTPGAQINQTMTGTLFGVDFNPVADRLRVISDSGQSLRINVTDGATIVDGAINPAGRVVGAVAYTNSVSGAATTALYDLDLASSSLLLQSPPNDGTTTVVGSLGVSLDAGAPAGFDIRRVGAADFSYAALRVGGTTSLYTINLGSGAATLVGAIGGNPLLRGIAVVEAPVLPALPAGSTAILLRGDNALVRVPVATPGSGIASTLVTGLLSGDVLVGIDHRPATAALYGLARTGNLYVIDPFTGAATFRAQLNVAMTGSRFAVDFNPAADRLRVVSDTGQSLRTNVDDGSTTVDGAINPAGAQITSAAYTNSFAGTTSTVLFDIDAASSTLAIQNPPNAGTLQVVGPLGVTPAGDSGFDIFSSGGNNAAIAALQVAGTLGLYHVNLTTGAATLIGAVGGNPAIVGMAISGNPIGAPQVNQPVPIDAHWAMLLTAMGVITLAGLRMRRRRI